MIEISEKDLPITVAQKLITATYDIPSDFLKTIDKSFGGDGTREAFTGDELEEIAQYLMTYVKHKMEKVITNET